MMNMFLRRFPKYVSILLLLISLSCNSSDDSGQDPIENRTLIFGWYADNSCSGDCANIYKIANGKIYKDIDSNFPIGNSFEGNFQELTNANYQDFVGLLNQLPTEIFTEPNGFLDCSDCTIDFGGYYLEYDSDSTNKTWRFQNVRHPAYMESYRSLLMDKLELLNSI